MSETVAISLITASAGFFGALLGAVSAVFGPWWLRRSDRLAEASATRAEERRVAIVEWIDAHVYLNLYPNRDPGDPELLSRTQRVNSATTTLTSRLTAKEEALVDWLAGLSGAADKYHGQDYLNFLSVGSQLLLSWHRGTKKLSDMKPFTMKTTGGGIVIELDDAEEWDL